MARTADGMDLLASFNHVLNLFLPAIALGAVAAALAKLVWRRELAGRRWHDLAAWAGAAASAATIAGLVITAHDGRMATYAAMVVASAAAIAWRGFGR